MIIFTGRPDPLGQRIGERHVHGAGFAAKVAPNRTGVDPNAVLRHSQRTGQLPPQAKRLLVVRPHLNAARLVDGHDAGVGLHVALVHPGGGEGVLKNQVRFAEPLRDIAAGPRVLVTDIATGLDRSGWALVDRGAVVDDRRLGLHRLHRVEDSRQLGILHLDPGEGLFGRVHIVRDHRRHFLAHKPHFLLGQQGRIAQRPADQHAAEITAGEHGMDAGHLQRACGVDVDDAGVGQRAAQHLPPEHPWQHQVPGVARLSRDLLGAIFAGHGCSHHCVCRHITSLLWTEHVTSAIRTESHSLA